MDCTMVNYDNVPEKLTKHSNKRGVILDMFTGFGHM